MIRFIFICFVFVSIYVNGSRRDCVDLGVLFSDKILRSPTIVYGESLAKHVYHETETEFLFNVTFRVDCILKGDLIENRIEITNAGIKADRRACQFMDPGKLYIIFIEKCQFNKNAFCPIDFQERLVDSMTYELLERTCHLKRLVPLNSIEMNTCPNVSTNQHCSNDEVNVKIRPKQKIFNYDNSFNKPIFNQIADSPKNKSRFLTISFIWIIVILVVCNTILI